MTVCGAGTRECGGACVDLNVDVHHCGGCDVSCSVGQVCSAAQCSSTCQNDQQWCAVDGKYYCAETQSDNDNCGSCGAVCGPQHMCVAGSCSSTCAPNQSLCEPEDAPAVCTDVSTDVANCGGCGIACGPHAYCSSGACGCVDGYSKCGSSCIDIDTDIENCGACGVGCAGTCSSGRCRIALAPTKTFGPIVVDATNVYYVDNVYPAPTVAQVPIAGGVPTTLGTESSAIGDLTTNSVSVYWTGGPGIIRAAPVGGGATTTLVTMPVNEYVASIVADGASVYYAQDGLFDGGDIYAVPAGGGTPVDLYPYAAYEPKSLVLDSGTLFWYGSYGFVGSMATNGTQYQKAYVTISTVSRLCAYGGKIAAYDSYGKGIYAFDEGVSSPYPQLLTVAQNAVVALACDGVSAYWLESNNATYDLKRIALGGGSASVLNSGILEAGGIAVDSTSVYWNSLGIMKLTPK